VPQTIFNVIALRCGSDSLIQWFSTRGTPSQEDPEEMSRRARDLTPSTTYKVVERPFWGDSSLWSDFEGQGGRNKTKVAITGQNNANGAKTLNHYH